jgi:hypothetical protein
VARGCARVDYKLATAKTCSNSRVDVDRHRLLAVFQGGKTFSHGLGPRLCENPKNPKTRRMIFL